MKDSIIAFIRKYFKYLVADGVCLLLLIICLIICNVQSSNRTNSLLAAERNVSDLNDTIAVLSIAANVSTNTQDSNNDVINDETNSANKSFLKQLLNDTFGWDDYDQAKQYVMATYGIMDQSSPYMTKFFSSPNEEKLVISKQDIKLIGYLNGTYDYLIYLEFKNEDIDPVIITCSISSDGYLFDINVQ